MSLKRSYTSCMAIWKSIVANEYGNSALGLKQAGSTALRWMA